MRVRRTGFGSRGCRSLNGPWRIDGGLTISPLTGHARGPAHARRETLLHPADSVLDDLFAAALAARKKAYAPYSRFSVGAAVRGGSGRVYAGCNVENAAYPVGTCAEAGAIAAMISGGDTVLTEALVLADASDPVTPCGACRQRLAEFAGSDTPVHAARPDGVRKTYTLGALLPHGFGPGSLPTSAP